MKFNILMTGIFALGLTVSSCGDSFLDVSSKTESTTGNFYKTEGDAWRALIGCYDGWRQISSNPGIGFYVASTVMGDECFGASGQGDNYDYQLIDGFDQARSSSSENIYEQDWKSYYAGVYRCNEFIAHEDQINWTDETNVKGLYMGECHALRALLYFDMVRLWENIPLFLEPVNENRAQAHPDSVYSAIASDLKYAIENIPADANLGTSNSGRITKFAAEAVMARVWLFYTGYYKKDNLAGITKADIQGYLNDVVSSNNYELVPSFASLWPAASLVPKGEDAWDTSLSTYAGSANKEILLAQKFTPTQDYNGNNDSNRWQVLVGMRSINWAPYGKGWGIATVAPSFVERFSNDPRFKPSVIDMVNDGVSASADFNSGVKDWREYTGYCIKKYSPIAFANGNNASRPDGSGDFQITNSQDWVIMRYADVLLMVSELGGVPSMTAQAALDAVRQRAGLASVPATLENVMNERAMELAFEGIRYWDLLRQGVDVMADAVCASAGAAQTAGLPVEVTYNREKIVNTRGFVQIPVNQITLSDGMLKQNAGWVK